MKWNTKRVALAGGIIWALGMFVTTIISIYTNGYAQEFLNIMASIYPGYTISLAGSVIGAIYGFLDVFVLVYIFTWIYKKLGK